jgi:Flp pilus assembly protein TadG
MIVRDLLGASCARFARAEDAASAVEFALLLPVISLILFSMIAFGTTLYNYEVLAGAVASGARQFAVSRGSTTPVTTTQSLVYASAPGMSSAKMVLTFAVSGTACTTDATCSAALKNGVPATLTASYPCNLSVLGANFAPGCQLAASTTFRVE